MGASDVYVGPEPHSATGEGSRHRAQTGAEQRLAMLEQMLAVTPVIIAAADADARYTWVYNPSGSAYLGNSLGRSDSEIAGDNPGAVALEKLKRDVLRTGRARRADVVFTSSRGDRVYDVTAQPDRSRSGKVIGVRTIAFDVTGRHDADSEHDRLWEREHTARVLAEAEGAHTRTLLHNAPAGILFWMRGDELATMNRALMQMLARPVAPPVQTPCLDELRGADGAPLSAEQFPCVRALQGETITGEEMSLLRPDGRFVPVLVNAGPVPDPATPRGVVISFQDISDRKKLEQLQRDWLGLVSHDLRTPLQNILAAADLLAGTDPQAAPEASALAETLMRNARAMQRIIDDVLEVGRADVHGLRVDRKLASLRAIVDRVLDYAIVPNDRQRVRLELPEELPLVPFDSPRIERALLNLLTNALKFSPPHSPIEIGARVDTRYARLWVRDWGEGLSRADSERIFERYESSAASRARGGVGIGLYACRLIARAHDGECWCESEPGRGATFYLSLARGDAQQACPPG